MPPERKENIVIIPEGSNGVINVITSSSESALYHRPSDGKRNKENQMHKELGKASLSIGTIIATGAYGIEQIIDGFNNTNAQEMANGVLFILLASTILPVANRFYEKAKLSKREATAIDTNKKPS